MILGLLSITFRKLSRGEVVDWATRAKVDGIEWGGDVHVPPGDATAAFDAKRLCRDAGLSIPAYGSYFRVGHDPVSAFSEVLDAAALLGAPVVRVWAGKVGSGEADAATRARVADDARLIAERAAREGVTVAAEWHGGTLTDTASSAADLFAAVDHPNFRTLWQPHPRTGFDACVRDFAAAAPRLVGVHVFQWDVVTAARHPLAAGASAWPTYLRLAKDAGAAFASLEFVKDDAPEQMVEDAAVLRRWLDDAG